MRPLSQAVKTILWESRKEAKVSPANGISWRRVICQNELRIEAVNGIMCGNMTFEENLAKLEGIVSEMEGGRLSLDDMMKNFEAGKKLVASCTQELESIRQRIEKVVSGNQEPPQVEPLDIV